MPILAEVVFVAGQECQVSLGLVRRSTEVASNCLPTVIEMRSNVAFTVETGHEVS